MLADSREGELCASFGLTEINQQRLCFHWSNLRPMVATANFSKGAYWNGQHHRRNGS